MLWNKEIVLNATFLFFIQKVEAGAAKNKLGSRQLYNWKTSSVTCFSSSKSVSLMFPCSYLFNLRSFHEVDNLNSFLDATSWQDVIGKSKLSLLTGNKIVYVFAGSC